ncbi:hypothetical protein HID58_013699 [Brassica napus]|uniref:Uncharacterized protein n=1 Tax=Brassica napus TaxID=3708 RepID=A0ABQ8E4P0_BRANA|nr:hypothetical protein HID58_013699 [Brassica napus]
MTKLKKPREALVEASEDGLLVKSQDPEFLLRECTGFSCRRPASSPSARNTIVGRRVILIRPSPHPNLCRGDCRRLILDFPGVAFDGCDALLMLSQSFRGIVDDFGVPGRTNPRSAEFQPAWVFANGMFGLVFCLNSRKARSWRFGTGKKPIVIKTVILAKYHVHKDDETEPLGRTNCAISLIILRK